MGRSLHHFEENFGRTKADFSCDVLWICAWRQHETRATDSHHVSVSLALGHSYQSPSSTCQDCCLWLMRQWGAMVTAMCNSSGQRIRCWRSFLAIWCFFSGRWNLTSREITVFLPGPISLVLISCGCIGIVNKVGHSWAGAANCGRVPTFMTSIGSIMRELYADHTGIPVLPGHSSPLT